MRKIIKPTKEQERIFQDVYTYFNYALFDNELTRCEFKFIRARRTVGMYEIKKHHCLFKKRWKTTIYLNPDYFYKSTEVIFSVLVHEAVHHWEFLTGTFQTYHGWRFANKLEILGLITSHTAKPGGNRVGKEMNHYIIPGKFLQSLANMPPSMRKTFEETIIKPFKTTRKMNRK